MENLELLQKRQKRLDLNFQRENILGNMQNILKPASIVCFTEAFSEHKLRKLVKEFGFSEPNCFSPFKY